MNSLFTYSIELITETNKLTEAFHLRYLIYKKAFPNITAHHVQPYEFDGFDHRSIHLALYTNDNGNKKLAGYCRFILPPFFSTNFLPVMVIRYNEYSVTYQNSEERLAFIEQLPTHDYRERVNLFCQVMESKNKIYTETSRFIIADQYRSPLLSSFFVTGMLAVLELLNIRYCFFACAYHHIPFYEKFGLTLFPGIMPFDNELYGRRYGVFGSVLDSLHSIQNTISSLRTQLEAENKITFSKAF